MTQPIRHCSDTSYEFRFNAFQIENRADSNEMIIRGKAVPFDSITRIADWFDESIDSGAFDKTINENRDVMLKVMHADLPLARTSTGNMTLEKKSDGIYFEAHIDKRDPDVQRVAYKMDRGEVNKMSVGMIVQESLWDEEDRDNLSRTIMRAEMIEISIVDRPAYDDTDVSVAKRSLEEFRSNKNSGVSEWVHAQRELLTNLKEVIFND